MLGVTMGDVYSTVINLISHWVSVLSHIHIYKKKGIFMELNISVWRQCGGLALP